MSLHLLGLGMVYGFFTLEWYSDVPWLKNWWSHHWDHHPLTHLDSLFPKMWVPHIIQWKPLWLEAETPTFATRGPLGVLQHFGCRRSQKWLCDIVGLFSLVFGVSENGIYQQKIAIALWIGKNVDYPPVIKQGNEKKTHDFPDKNNLLIVNFPLLLLIAGGNPFFDRPIKFGLCTFGWQPQQMEKMFFIAPVRTDKTSLENNQHQHLWRIYTSTNIHRLLSVSGRYSFYLIHSCIYA